MMNCSYDAFNKSESYSPRKPNPADGRVFAGAAPRWFSCSFQAGAEGGGFCFVPLPSPRARVPEEVSAGPRVRSAFRSSLSGHLKGKSKACVYVCLFGSTCTLGSRQLPKWLPSPGAADGMGADSQTPLSERGVCVFSWSLAAA